MSGLGHIRVLIVGAGGLGIPAALRLAQSGLTQITLIDPERIELSNLARQIIYRTSDLGLHKAEVAAQRLSEQYQGVVVNPMVGSLDADNCAEMISRHDFIIDGTDDPPAKFLISDACVAARRPFVYGGVLGFSGQAMTVLPGRTACLRCLFEEPPTEGEGTSCREAGILGPVAGIIGAVQAAEAILFARGEYPALAGRILTYDGRNSRTRTTSASPRRGCGCGACDNWSNLNRTGAAAGSGTTTEGKI
ncbi:MAG TPA: HesA/MoeB/ThiF family protein [Candidatus Binataceae bacterium]|jgi:molybdopterin/thiamine biosynthesis adenylyltransferase|nr:HesA/MoeB/ThiF family protein [Candidatus Binataceae bacterium]